MTTLDLRRIEPDERRLAVFDTFDTLAPGEALILIHAHPSKPLFYLFLAASPGGFTWDYLEQGPSVWRIRIGKTGKQAGHTYCLH